MTLVIGAVASFGLVGCASGQAGTPTSPPASAATTAARILDAADRSACNTYTAGMKQANDLFTDLDNGKASVDLAAYVLELSAEKVRTAASAASPELATLMQRAAGSLDVLQSKMENFNPEDKTLDIGYELTAVRDTQRAVVAYCNP